MCLQMFNFYTLFIHTKCGLFDGSRYWYMLNWPCWKDLFFPTKSQKLIKSLGELQFTSAQTPSEELLLLDTLGVNFIIVGIIMCVINVVLKQHEKPLETPINVWVLHTEKSWKLTVIFPMDISFDLTLSCVYRQSNYSSVVLVIRIYHDWCTVYNIYIWIIKLN